MRTKLEDISSIPQVVAQLTLDEKLNLVGGYKACHTLEIPDMEVPALCLMDGATGVNGVQAVLDYITAPDLKLSPEQAANMSYAKPEFVDLNRADLQKASEEYQDDPVMAGLVAHIAVHRPGGRQYISFPSGVVIGAAFDPAAAHKIGQAVGWELRNSKIDVCMGPNVDIARDPLGGRNYEMYGEDPELVSQMAVGFIQGMQSTGVAACAKHFIANNQETNRNTKDTHLSERTLHEIYSRGFFSAVQDGRTKAIMSAYNAINGTFTTYNRELLTGLLREQWGFEGTIVSDWGAASENKEDALAAGLDLILCGPNDMSACKKAIEDGRLPVEILDARVAGILKLIVELRDEQQSVPAKYDQSELLETACQTVINGSVLLKNEDGVLPLNGTAKVAFYGRRSKEMLEFGSGSTAVITNLHSNIFDEFEKCHGTALFETMEGADTLIYTVAAPAGENVDRDSMTVEDEDRDRLSQVLRAAKEKGLKTVVLLNISGPVEMASWLPYADSVLCIFLPGCMGGVAAASMLTGAAYPGGKLSISLPVRYEDSPSYPNFPGEHNDVYYGEGIFVGYRSYEKRKLPVQFPFGFGLSYTTFALEPQETNFAFDAREQEFLEIPVKVKNTGSRRGSEVVQIYACEKKPKVLRPVKELVGFAKVTLAPGEEAIATVCVRRESLRYFDAKQRRWVLPVGALRLFIGQSSADICFEAELEVQGVNPYPLSGESTIGEILQNPAAVMLVNQFTGNMFDQLPKETLDFMINRKLGDILSIGMIAVIPDAVKLNAILQELYDKLSML